MSDKKGTKDMKRVLGCIRRADERYHMIREGDKICVGVSGGKDSLLLLYGLKLYQRFCYRHFDVCGVMLDLGITDQDLAPVEDFAREIGVPFDIIRTDIGDVVFNVRKESHPCALCAKLRRGALNDAARQRGCNLVALGHNRDDVIETFFMSLLYESRLNTFGPVTYLGRKEVTVIRPLVFLPEKQALSVATRLELPIRKPNCPVAGMTKREEMKQVMRFFTSLIPDAEERIMNAIADTEKYGMWDRLRLPPRDIADMTNSASAPELCRDCPSRAASAHTNSGGPHEAE